MSSISTVTEDWHHISSEQSSSTRRRFTSFSSPPSSCAYELSAVLEVLEVSHSDFDDSSRMARMQKKVNWLESLLRFVQTDTTEVATYVESTNIGTTIFICSDTGDELVLADLLENLSSVFSPSKHYNCDSLKSKYDKIFYSYLSKSCFSAIALHLKEASSSIPLKMITLQNIVLNFDFNAWKTITQYNRKGDAILMSGTEIENPDLCNVNVSERVNTVIYEFSSSVDIVLEYQTPDLLQSICFNAYILTRSSIFRQVLDSRSIQCGTEERSNLWDTLVSLADYHLAVMRMVYVLEKQIVPFPIKVSSITELASKLVVLPDKLIRDLKLNKFSKPLLRTQIDIQKNSAKLKDWRTAVRSTSSTSFPVQKEIGDYIDLKFPQVISRQHKHPEKLLLDVLHVFRRSPGIIACSAPACVGCQLYSANLRKGSARVWKFSKNTYRFGACPPGANVEANTSLLSTMTSHVRDCFIHTPHFIYTP
ncbi:hypothetical protein CANCADRAFT_45604 [Tortispora caseinolytica NRRL Y-17796]|uniref:Uncharacterized protein n=1 Tax=Tortispora caseinolytica NRRL Y-17796 TaxID=767744 RepID=A0A1E4TBL6_9ASCO|nr:hypothetical protein CANCADRAFT_45604 [Tortispora caseinolytica NRRL Y-17796]